MHIEPVQLTHRPRLGHHSRLQRFVIAALRTVRPHRREPNEPIVDHGHQRLEFDLSVDDRLPSTLVFVDRHRRQEPIADDALVPDLPTTHTQHGQATRIRCRRSSNRCDTDILAKPIVPSALISNTSTIPARALRPPVPFKDTDLHQRCCAVGSNLLLPGGKVAAASRITPIPVPGALVAATAVSPVAEHRSW